MKWESSNTYQSLGWNASWGTQGSGILFPRLLGKDGWKSGGVASRDTAQAAGGLPKAKDAEILLSGQGGKKLQDVPTAK